jgi:hypothetical protein
MEEIMKIVIATAAALLAASSFAFAADNGGKNDGKDGMNNDPATTGSVTKDATGDIDDAMKCREGVSGGAPCQEDGTVMPQ